MRNPRRTAATAAALMIGITLVGVVSILAASMKASATAAVNETLRADFVVAAKGSIGGGSGTFSPVVADRLRKTKEVAMVSEFRTGQWGLNGATKTLIAVDPKTVTEMHDLDPSTSAAAGRLDDESVLVRASIAERQGWQVGDEVPMTFARTGTRPMLLADTFSNTAVRSDFVVSLGAFKDNYAQQIDAQVEVMLEDGVTMTAGRVAIEKALAEFSTVQVMDRSQVLAAQSKQIDSLLVPVTALLALSVVIALLGIANTLALSIHERTREVGLLRAVGMGRGQLRSMVRAEAVIVACLGAILGVAVAVFFGWALVSAMHDLGVTELVVPVGQLSALVAAATGAGLVAGVLPARRAGRLGVLDAIAGGSSPTSGSGSSRALAASNRRSSRADSRSSWDIHWVRTTPTVARVSRSPTAHRIPPPACWSARVWASNRGVWPLSRAIRGRRARAAPASRTGGGRRGGAARRWGPGRRRARRTACRPPGSGRGPGRGRGSSAGRRSKGR